MSTQQLQTPVPVRGSSSRGWWLLGLVLLVLGIGLVISSVGQRVPFVPSANSTKVVSSQATQQGALPFGPEIAASYGLNGQSVHPFGPEIAASYGVPVSESPDAATQGVNGYIQAHNRTDAVPQSFTEAVRTYNSTGGQTVPDAATQGVNGYIQAHNRTDAAPQSFTEAVGAYNRAGGQSVPDAATQGILGYIRAHNGN